MSRPTTEVLRRALIPPRPVVIRRPRCLGCDLPLILIDLQAYWGQATPPAAWRGEYPDECRWCAEENVP